MLFPHVSIITLNWNEKKILKNCLKSLFKNTDYKNFKVIVVDNGSTDNSVEMVKKEFKNVDIVENKENLYFIKGNNIGIKYALKKYNPDYLLLINNDTIIFEKDWLIKLVRVAENDKKVGIVGPKLIFPNKRVQWSGRRKESNLIFLIFQTLSASLNPGMGTDKRLSEFIGEVNTASGACMMIKKDLINEIGFLDEKLAPAFQEDIEYSFRTWKNGYKVVYVGTSNVIHLQSYTVNRHKEKSKEKLYLALRNSIIVSKKYFGFWKTLLFGLPIFLFTVLLERKNKTLAFSINNLRFRKNLLSKISILNKALKYLFI